jgi:antitoxin MazE
METIVQKLGNSLGIRIPAAYAKELNLKKGSAVEINEEGGKIVIYPSHKTLEDMLDRVTADNMPEIVETGESVDREEW